MKKEDISLKTKTNIATSLKKLLARKSFEKITVREILEEANITRSTFYYHFEDIYDLMKWIVNTEMLAPFEKCENVFSWEDNMLQLLKNGEKNRQICICAYKGIGHDELQRIFLKNTRDIMKKYMDTRLDEIPARPEHVDFITNFYTMALVDALVQWIQDPNACSPEKMFDYLKITVITGIDASLRQSASSPTP